MAFELINLQMKSSPEGCFYIFDSNILLPQLGLPDGDNIYSPFLSFLGKVVKEAMGNPATRILITDLQLSEVFNKLLRYRARVEWDQGGRYVEAEFNKYYKNIYRKSDLFVTDFDNIKSDFDAIADAVQVVKLSILDTYEKLIDFDPKKLDFNDNHILHTAIEHDAVLVTNDRDYYNTNIRLATYNSRMIQDYKMDLVLAAKAAKLAKK
jgi:predicted nucleic acid-binding protein